MKTLDARLTQLEAEQPPQDVVLKVVYTDAATGATTFDEAAPEVHVGRITVKGLRTPGRRADDSN